MKNGFYAVLSRMKYIRRWGLMRAVREENLSEHSLEVAFIAHALALLGNKRLGKSYNAERVALLAMFHDACEIITGDLPTPVKYYNDDIKTAYKGLEKSAENRLISMLPDDLRVEYTEIIGGDCECEALIKAADKLSAYIKCLEEENAGNKEFSVAKSQTLASIKALSCEEADIFMSEFINSYNLTLDEQT